MPPDVDEAVAGLPSLYEASTRVLKAMKAAGVDALVIDLRGDDGGVEPIVVPVLYQLFGDDYFGHAFHDQYVTRASALYLRQMNRTIEDVRREKGEPGLEVGDYVFEKRDAGTAGERRTRQLADYAAKGFAFARDLQAQEGKPLYRPRRLLVVCDARTFSAAFQLLAYLKEMGAEVVGVPPGQAPNAFTDMTRFALTRSKLAGSISNSEQLFLPDAPGARVFPIDHPLTWETAAAFGFDGDAPLTLALSLLGSAAR